MGIIKSLLSRLYYFIKYHWIDVTMGHRTYLPRGVVCEGHNHFGKNTIFQGRIGYASNIAEDCIISANIGKYCSIGRGCKTVLFVHPTRIFVSTHPAFYSLLKQSGFTYVKEQKYPDAKYVDADNKIGVSVGNDVFIGAGVTILGGIKIGDGAVIGAGSLVTKDIEPYTIVAGVPAKVIGKRFEQEMVDYLLELKWWDKSTTWIEKYAEYFEDAKRLKTVLDKE